MGCSDSKSAQPKETNKKNSVNRPNNDASNQDLIFVSIEEASEYLQTELGIREERARKIIDRINSSKDEKFSEVDLESLSKTVKEIRNEMQSKFAEFDKDGNGLVSIQEALSVIKLQMPECAESTLKAIISRYDQNQDGNIDYHEFTYFYCAMKCKSEELKNKFIELDKDKSGFIEPNEIVDVLRKGLVLEGPDDDQMAKSVIEDFDTNKDGKLSKDEFVNLWVKMFGLG